MAANGEEFQGQILVTSRIIDYLSSGLYDSPAASLKELVNNSYDADATRVDIFIKPDADQIAIQDDGDGMTREQFEEHFSHVSESRKRSDSDVTGRGRPKIGKIGIGFIAANELCRILKIFSTVRGSTDELRVEIDFGRMSDPEESRRKGSREFATADYVGHIAEADVDAHYTRVILESVKGEARQILSSAAKWPRPHGRARSLYGLKPESIAEELADPSVTNWGEFDSYSENMLRVGLNVPIRYHDAWTPPDVMPAVRKFATRTARLDFQVFWDGSELRKPVVFAPGNREHLVRQFKYRGKEVAAEGYFFAQHGVLRPEDLNGVLIRIRHAAVGGYERNFLGFPSSEGTLFQRWISAELWADDRLEDAMNIDRKTLRITHPAYVELQRAIHERLSDVIRDVRKTIHGTQAAARQRSRLKAERQAVEKIARTSVNEISVAAARDLVETWKRASTDATIQRRLLRRYSVSEMYDIVLDVAEETLSPSDVRRFLRALNDRLST